MDQFKDFSVGLKLASLNEILHMCFFFGMLGIDADYVSE